MAMIARDFVCQNAFLLGPPKVVPVNGVLSVFPPCFVVNFSGSLQVIMIFFFFFFLLLPLSMDSLE